MSVFGDDITKVGHRESKNIYLEDPTQLIYQENFGFTQRAAIDKVSIRPKTDLFQRISSSNADETPKRRVSHTILKVSVWSYDMKGHAEQCVVIYFEVLVSQLKHAALLCIVDHQLKKEDFDFVGELTHFSLYS